MHKYYIMRLEDHEVLNNYFTLKYYFIKNNLDTSIFAFAKKQNIYLSTFKGFLHAFYDNTHYIITSTKQLLRITNVLEEDNIIDFRKSTFGPKYLSITCKVRLYISSIYKDLQTLELDKNILNLFLVNSVIKYDHQLYGVKTSIKYDEYRYGLTVYSKYIETDYVNTLYNIHIHYDNINIVPLCPHLEKVTIDCTNISNNIINYALKNIKILNIVNGNSSLNLENLKIKKLKYNGNGREKLHITNLPPTIEKLWVYRFGIVPSFLPQSLKILKIYSEHDIGPFNILESLIKLVLPDNYNYKITHIPDSLRILELGRYYTHEIDFNIDTLEHLTVPRKCWPKSWNRCRKTKIVFTHP